ncbi:MAG: UbiE/COQ5 methyltransferase [Microgenomates group bacterium GW2011_GWC1_37_8]|uniref:Methyltransferase type 11 n=1 Tax=Candidatus Woesebacteria bacterium GW2011_GWB1_38_8 TaxID=1618570 RepID=A0A0G0L372_9BACT|nr:MAG: UbiE/COQ5 methyltransferase [Microgenomates group bacterium GW2011_GWC1_37_8]KKQ85467.1 MAG: Methyltransferase type 11 [Candidatus Woesebacteria bacterium GW2011_GWB1_38_8]
MVENRSVVMPKNNYLNAGEWEKRAKRPGLLSVMSIRWSEDECRKATESLKNEIFSFLPKLAGKRILEIGCGIGRITLDLAKRSAQLYAIDISPAMLSRAQRVIKSNNVTFFSKCAHNTGFSDNYFDVVLEVTVLQHIVNESLFRKTLAEIKRVIKPDGFIFLCGEVSNIHNKVSPITIIRTLSEYKKAMKPFKLMKVKNFLCVTDNYLLTLWK